MGPATRPRFERALHPQGLRIDRDLRVRSFARLGVMTRVDVSV
jgi:hypothetical protein